LLCRLLWRCVPRLDLPSLTDSIIGLLVPLSLLLLLLLALLVHLHLVQLLLLALLISLLLALLLRLARLFWWL